MKFIRISDDNIHSTLDALCNAEYVSYDTETTGLNVRKDVVIGMSFAVDDTTGYYLATHEYVNNKLQKLPESKYAMEILQAINSKKVIMHNASFDVRITKSNFDIDMLNSLYCDTVVLKHTVDEQPPFGLKQIAIRLKKELNLDAEKEANEEQIELRKSIVDNGGSATKEKYELYKADVNIIAKYAAADAVLTFKIFKYYSNILKHENLEKFFYIDEVMPLLKEVTIPMESRGIRLNVEQLEKYRNELAVEIDNIQTEILADIEPILGEFYSWYFNYNYPPKRTGEFAQSLCECFNLDLPKTKSGRLSMTKKALEGIDSKYAKYLLGEGLLSTEEIAEVHSYIKAHKYPDPIFNLNSTHHIGKLLINCLGESSTTKTPTGRDKVDTNFLDEIKDKHYFIPKIIKYKKLVKLKSSYYDRFFESHEEGIFYPQFSQHRTVSGRYGGDLQQLPREIEEGEDPTVAKYTNEIRRLFIVRDGYKFIDSDYCLHPSTELLTKDRGWQKILDINDTDMVWQVDHITEEGSWCKPLRIIKRDFYGIMYTFGNRRGSLTVTENHTMLWARQDRRNKPSIEIKREIIKSHQGIPINGLCFLQGSSSYKSDNQLYSLQDLNMVALLSADSYQDKNKENTYVIEISKPRKIEEVRQMLGPEKFIRPKRGKQTMDPHVWHVQYSHPLLLPDKSIDMDRLHPSQAHDMLIFLAQWDGYITRYGALDWGSTNKEFVERVQAYFVRNGYQARLWAKDSKKENQNTYYLIRIKKKNTFKVSPADVKSYIYKGKVGCVTVDTGFILVRSDGQTFVTGNCSLEPHVFAHVSNEDNIKTGLAQGDDFYSTIGLQMEEDPQFSANTSAANYLGKVDKPKRTRLKAIALGIPYGMESYKLSKELNISQEDADKLVKNYLKAFPNLHSWMKQSELDAVTNGYIKTQAGRKINLKTLRAFWYNPTHRSNLFDSKGQLINSLELWKKFEGSPRLYEEYKAKRKLAKNLLNLAKNFQIQSLAASITNRACIAIARELKRCEVKGSIVSQVHDQIIVEIEENRAEKWQRVVQYIMENTYKISVPLKAPPQISTNFQDGH